MNLNASANAIQIAHQQYREALMRSRYKRGDDLDQIVSEFGSNAVELWLVLEDLLTPDDRIRIESALHRMLTPTASM
jgi:hypothetical protein